MAVILRMQCLIWYQLGVPGIETERLNYPKQGKSIVLYHSSRCTGVTNTPFGSLSNLFCQFEYATWREDDNTMTSSNGNIFPDTGPLWGEFTSHRWIPLTKAGDVELWCFFFICAWTNGWVSNRDADDLRRHRAHYDVTVMNATTAITMVADVLVAGVQIGARLPPCWLTYDLTVPHGLYCAISRSNQFIKECSREVERWAIRLFLCSSSHGDFYALWCNVRSVSIAAEKSMEPLFIKVN